MEGARITTRPSPVTVAADELPETPFSSVSYDTSADADAIDSHQDQDVSSRRKRAKSAWNRLLRTETLLNEATPRGQKTGPMVRDSKQSTSRFGLQQAMQVGGEHVGLVTGL